ncbi:MAG: hypothetical protein QG675_312, partial [Patescibacteria group bacterium]|nr:hypothetical protein [Patescibacteria group bacterium]
PAVIPAGPAPIIIRSYIFISDISTIIALWQNIFLELF